MKAPESGSAEDYEKINDLLAGVEAEIRRSFEDTLEERIDDQLGPVAHLSPQPGRGQPPADRRASHRRLAAVVHGSPFPTEDADITPDDDRRNLDRLAAALRELNARFRTEGIPTACLSPATQSHWRAPRPGT